MFRELEYSKVMKINPSLVRKGAQVSWLRAARHVVACGVVMVAGISSAIAQTFATSTVAGSVPGVTGIAPGFADGAGQSASGARFQGPAGIAVDTTNHFVYIADTANQRIRKLDLATGLVSTIAGSASTGSADNTTGTSATFSSPAGVAWDGGNPGNLYVADTGNSVIRKIVLSGTFTVTTIAGQAGLPGLVNNASGPLAKFSAPRGLVVDTGNIYVADSGNNVIRKIVVATTDVSTFAGSPAGASGTTDSPTNTLALFSQPFGITSDGGTNLYVADTGNHSIRKIAIAGGVTTFAGVSGVSGSDDTFPATSAHFKNPQGVAVVSGTVYISDTGNNTVRAVPISSNQPVTLAGTAGQGSLTDGLGAAARFQSPWGIAVDIVNSVNIIYVGDSVNQAIRRVGPASIPTVTTPVTAPVTVGATATFTVTVGGNPTPTIQWERQAANTTGFVAIPGAGTTINGATFSGATTSVLTIANATAAINSDQFRATVTNGVQPSPSVSSAGVAIVVQQVPTITSAATTNFAQGSTGTFTFTATGSPAPTFDIPSGNSPGSLNGTTGVYTLVSASGGPYQFTIRASNGVGTPATQLFNLVVQNGAVITTQPASVGTGLGGTVQFTVGATGTPAPTSYQWYRNAGGVSGFLQMSDVGGVYFGTNTATLTVQNAQQIMSGDQFQVVVSNGVGSPVTSSPATLTIQQAPQITTANNTIFGIGVQGTFQVQATGSPAPTFSIVSGAFNGSISQTGLISYFPNDTTGSPFVFTIQASNGVGSPSQQSFTLTVTPAGAFPSFTTQPVSASVSIGQPATFTVAATGSPQPTYQWQYQPAAGGGFVSLSDNGIYSGTQTATLTVLAATTGMNGDQFQCIANNIVNSVPSSASSSIVTLTVNVGTIITTIAGQAGVTGTVDGTGTAAQFANPYSVAVDLNGNVFVADTSASVIRKITAAGVVSTFAGSPGLTGSADGQGSAARFNGPSGVAVDGSGNVYVADTNNHTIRGISAGGNVITLAGAPGVIGSTDTASGPARFTYPFGLALDSAGSIYVADTYNHTIRLISQNGTVSTLAGLAGTRGTTDGAGSAARFAFPTGITVASQGLIYVADSGSSTIRRIAGNGVTTYAGTAGISGTAEGAALTLARFTQPNGVGVDSTGVVYVADSGNHTIRRIAPGVGALAGDVSTLAGLAGVIGSTDGSGTAARFNQPNGLAVDSAGNIYIADTQNRTIRRSGAVTAPSITTQPSNVSTAPNTSATFRVVAAGAPAPTVFHWQRKPADGSTDFVNLTNDGVTYSGVDTATLTVSNITTAMNNDQFRVFVSNFITPDAISNPATLSTVIAAPVFTSGASASFKATELGAFTVVATGNPAATFSLTGAPAFLSINPSSGVMSGTAADTSGSPFTFTISATNGVTTTQTFTLTVNPAVVAPAITVQPVGGTIARGQTAGFNVTATGTALTYQWSKDGVAIAGATSSSLVLSGVQASGAGSYTVTVNNSLNLPVTSSPAVLLVNSAPIIVTQPQSQTALAGGTVSFSVVATGTPAPGYQWRVNGVPITNSGNVSGATSATLTITGVQATNAANYDVLVANGVGSVLSSLTQLTVATTATVPVITSSPAPRTVVVGGSTTLFVGANGTGGLLYQWRKNGTPLAGGNAATYTISNAQLTDSANYDAVVTNSAGSATSAPAAVTVISRSYAGYYLGAFGGAGANYALFVRPDNSAVLLGYLPSVPAGIRSDLTVSDSGVFTYNQGGIALSGAIASNGSITGSLIGGPGGSFTGSKTTDFGSSLAAAGYYQGAAVNTSSTIAAIVNPVGQAFILVQANQTSDGGQGAIDGNNRVTLSTARESIIATFNPDTSTVSATVTAGTVVTSYSGASDAVIATQRLSNISSRARVGTGDAVTIAGFVISGQNSKPVLIRAIGPTLAVFGVTTQLTAPKLELFRSGSSTAIATNTGWTTSGNTAAITAATLQAGAFALSTTAADSVIFATLAPGAYTAVISSANNTPGVALAEVYDLSAPAAGQKLFNISTRASTGTGDSVLTAGIVVSGASPKRVLIRGVGPTLASLGVTGALAQPILSVVKDGVTVATNSNWSTSVDATAIAAAATQVGAFALANGSADAAMIISLAPGNYSALVAGANGTAGIAIIEVYELP